MNITEMFLQIRLLSKFAVTPGLWTSKGLLARVLIPNVMFKVVAAFEYSLLPLATIPFTDVSTALLPSVGDLLLFDMVVYVAAELFYSRKY